MIIEDVEDYCQFHSVMAAFSWRLMRGRCDPQTPANCNEERSVSTF